MALVDWIGCDLRDTGEFDAVSVGAGGSATFITAGLTVGQAAVRLNGGTGVTTADMVFGSRSVLTARFLVDLGSMGTVGGAGRLIAAFITAGGENVEIRVTKSAGGLYTIAVMRAAAAGAHVFVQSTDFAGWCLVMVSLDDGNNDVYLRVRRLGGDRTMLEAEHTTAGTLVGPWTTLRLQGAAGENWDFHQLIVTDSYTDRPDAEIFVYTVTLTADDTQTQWDASAGARWAAVDERPPDDSDYISTSTDNEVESFQFASLALPADGGPASPILGRAVGFRATNNALAGSSEVQAAIRNAADTADANTGAFVAPPVGAYQTYRANVRTVVAAPLNTSNAQGIAVRSNMDLLNRQVRVSTVHATWVVDGSATRTDSGSGAEALTSKDVAAIDSGTGAEAIGDREFTYSDAGAGSDTVGNRDAHVLEAGAGADQVSERELSAVDAGSGSDALADRELRAVDGWRRTRWQHSAEGAPLGAAIVTFPQAAVPGSDPFQEPVSATWDDTHVHSGTMAIKLEGTTSRLGHNPGANPVLDSYLIFAGYWTAFPTALRTLLDLFDSASLNGARIAIRADGRLQLRDATGSVVPVSVGTIGLNEWTEFVVHVFADPTNGAMEVTFRTSAGVETVSFTGGNTRANIRRWRWTWPQGDAFWIDDLAIDDAPILHGPYVSGGRDRAADREATVLETGAGADQITDREATLVESGTGVDRHTLRDLEALEQGSGADRVGSRDLSSLDEGEGEDRVADRTLVLLDAGTGADVVDELNVFAQDQSSGPGGTGPGETVYVPVTAIEVESPDELEAEVDRPSELAMTGALVGEVSPALEAEVIG